jgi:hypothetical protein
MFVDKLRVAIPAQQDTKIVEPGHDSLQFDPVNQEDGQRNLIFPDEIQESVLQVLCALSCHFSHSFVAPIVTATIRDFFINDDVGAGN